MKIILLIANILTLTKNNMVSTLETINVKYYSPLTNEELIKQLNIPIHFKNYEFNVLPTYSEIGANKYYLYLLDLNDNFLTYEFTINVIDDIPPLILGPEIIYLNSPNLPHIDLIINRYYSYDEIDKSLPIFIEETNYNEPNKSEYYIKIYSHDKSNNITKKNIDIIITERDYSLFYIQNPSITLNKNTIYTPLDIIKILQNNYLLEKHENIKITSNNIQNIKYEETGIYSLSVELEFNEKIYNLNISINVIEEKNNKPIIVKIIKYIIKIIKQIKWRIA